MKTNKTIQRACGVLRERLTSEVDKNTTQMYMESWILPIIDAIELGDMKLVAQLTRYETVKKIEPKHEYKSSIDISCDEYDERIADAKKKKEI